MQLGAENCQTIIQIDGETIFGSAAYKWENAIELLVPSYQRADKVFGVRTGYENETGMIKGATRNIEIISYEQPWMFLSNWNFNKNFIEWNFTYCKSLSQQNIEQLQR